MWAEKLYVSHKSPADCLAINSELFTNMVTTKENWRHKHSHKRTNNNNNSIKSFFPLSLNNWLPEIGGPDTKSKEEGKYE